MTTISADVVVVGSGVAGVLVADRLQRSGRKVTILEAGPTIDREQAVEVFRAATAKVPESPWTWTSPLNTATVAWVSAISTRRCAERVSESFS